MRDLKLDVSAIQNNDISLINQGSLSEQFVGQALINSQPPFEPGQLYFWARDSRGSQAEVDYLWQSGDKILPIEVKSGTSNRMRSLRMFQSQYQSPLAIRISSAPLDYANDLLSIPLYLTEELSRLIGSSLGPNH